MPWRAESSGKCHETVKGFTRFRNWKCPKVDLQKEGVCGVDCRGDWRDPSERVPRREIAPTLRPHASRPRFARRGLVPDWIARKRDDIIGRRARSASSAISANPGSHKGCPYIFAQLSYSYLRAIIGSTFVALRAGK